MPCVPVNTAEELFSTDLAYLGGGVLVGLSVAALIAAFALASNNRRKP